MAITDRFNLAITKHWVGRPETYWANTYEGLFTSEPATSESMKEIITKVGLAERILHLSKVEFSRGRISKWTPKTTVPRPEDEPDPPYDPSNLVTKALSGVGLIESGPTDGVEPKDVIYEVQRDADGGRLGGLEIRGGLNDSAVLGTNGDWNYFDRSEYVTRVENFKIAMDAIAADYKFNWVMFGQPQISTTFVQVGKRKVITSRTYGGVYTNFVTGWVLGVIRTDKSDHKWFNRT